MNGEKCNVLYIEMLYFFMSNVMDYLTLTRRSIVTVYAPISSVPSYLPHPNRILES
jgi:hypothetical protein